MEPLYLMMISQYNAVYVIFLKLNVWCIIIKITKQTT